MGVASLAEAWIETSTTAAPMTARPVASLAEAWIETRIPTRRCSRCRVASLAEAWIETRGAMDGQPQGPVASLAEAWIETSFIGSIESALDHGLAVVVADRALPEGLEVALRARLRATISSVRVNRSSGWRQPPDCDFRSTRGIAQPMTQHRFRPGSCPVDLRRRRNSL